MDHELRTALIQQHGIDKADADVLLTADDPHVLRRQAAHLAELSPRPAPTLVVPGEGQLLPAARDDQAEWREYVRDMFGRVDWEL